MLPASATVPRKPPPNLQALCDVLREGFCVNVQMSTLLKACTSSCDSGSLKELSCIFPLVLQVLSFSLHLLHLGALFISCLLVDQSFQITNTSKLSRVYIRQNAMYVTVFHVYMRYLILLIHFQFVCLTLYFHAPITASGVAFHLRRLDHLQLSLQIFVADPNFTVSPSGSFLFFAFVDEL
jgi:hypothetical protein